mmetsp:Transcript_19692/g.42391  ORF Transcript_19692/g.42391 Transcript_19692/m.42391 type:complete len:606 (-) Transcript_19692:525-2342(-)
MSETSRVTFAPTSAPQALPDPQHTAKGGDEQKGIHTSCHNAKKTDAAKVVMSEMSKTHTGFWRQYSKQMRSLVGDIDSKVILCYIGLGGIIVGVLAAAFAVSSEAVEDFFEENVKLANPKLVWLTLPLGLPFILMLSRVLFDGTAGSGIPMEMGALFLVDGDPNFGRIFSFNIIIGKFGLTLLSQLSGASAGREGPTVQISSSVFVLMIQLATRLKLPLITAALKRNGCDRGGEASALLIHDLIVVGGAAGISGAFETPIGGIVFAIEEMGNRYTKTLGHTMIVGVALSSLASIALQGFSPVFEDFAFGEGLSLAEWLAVLPFVSVLAGAVGGLWSLVCVYGVRMKKTAVISKLPGPYLAAFLCGLGCAMCGYWTNGETYGSGIPQAKAILAKEGQGPSLSFAPLKMVSLWLTYWSGIPGGIFSPTIAIGTGLGRCFFEVCKHWSPLIAEQGPTVAYIATTAYFAGVTQSPMTAFVILLGMLDQITKMKCAMLVAALLGWTASRFVNPKPLYGALAASLIPSLPPENVQCNLGKLPAPQYHHLGAVTGKHALFMELSEVTLPARASTGQGQSLRELKRNFTSKVLDIHTEYISPPPELVERISIL